MPANAILDPFVGSNRRILDGHDYSSQIIQRIAGVPVILDASGCLHSPFFEVEYDDRTIRFTSQAS